MKYGKPESGAPPQFGAPRSSERECRYGADCRTKDCPYRHPDPAVAATPSVHGVLIDDDAPAPQAAAPRPSKTPAPEAEVLRPAADDKQYEYEGVLMPCEKKIIDFVDGICRKICPCKTVRPEDLPGAAAAHKAPRNRYLWWEGLREDVPERYQRWEGIRERNVILSLVLRMCGYGRKQPTLVERVHLILLYASVWYFAYGLMLRQRGDICRKAWVDECVPRDRGGRCAGGVSSCAGEDMLALTPRGFNDYQSVSESTRVEMDTSKALCVREGAVESICELPMCVGPQSGRGSTTCSNMGGDVSGFCVCGDERGIVLELLVYTVFMKVLYLPFWYAFVLDLEAMSKGCHRVIQFLAIFLYTVLFFCGAVVIYQYVNQWRGWGWETGTWATSFCILCLFEVVKSFTLGFIVGSYVIENICCKCFSRIWKFMLA